MPSRISATSDSNRPADAASFRGALRIYLWALSYLRDYRRPAAAYLVIMLVTTAIGLAVPKFIQHFVDVVIPKLDFSSLGTLIAALAGLIVAMIALTLVGNVIQKHVAERSLHDLRLDIFRRLRALGYPFFEAHPTGQLLQMFTNEVRAIVDIYQRYLPRAIQLFFLTAIAFAMVIGIHPLLALVFVPSVLLYQFTGKKFAHKAALYGRETRDKHRELHGLIYNFLSGLVELRIGGKTEWIGKRIDDGFRDVARSSNREMFWLQSRGTARKSIIAYGLVAVFVFGILLVRAGSISVGEFIAFVFYYDIVIGRVTTLITNVTEQRVLLYQIENVYDKIHLKPFIAERPAAPAPKRNGTAIEFRNVSFRYANEVPVLTDVSFAVRPGEKVAVVGESGSGKSTLFKLLIRFHDPTAGVVRLGGVPVSELPLVDLRGAVGYVFQETYLFGSSIRDNILFGNPDATEPEVVAAAQAAFIHDFIMGLPEGYDTLAGERGVNLSGGQKQRIAIARLLLKNPATVLLDEATAALDNISEAEVLKALERLLAGRTTVAIAHRLSTIRHYDRIIVMDKGRIVEQGTHAQLMALRGTYYALETRGQAEDGVLENTR